MGRPVMGRPEGRAERGFCFDPDRPVKLIWVTNPINKGTLHVVGLGVGVLLVGLFLGSLEAILGGPF